MKNLMSLILIALLFVACENIETNNNTFQANIESDFFKAYTTTGVVDTYDVSMTIVGQTDTEELTLHTTWRGLGTYEVGLGSTSYGTIRDADGNLMTTDTEGSNGSITIAHRNDNTQLVSGHFEFNCVVPGVGTIAVHKGLFYDIPFTMIDSTNGD